MPVLDGPKIIYVAQNLVFGAENIGQEISPATQGSYSGGSGTAAVGFSSYLGQISTERDMQPFIVCSNSISPGRATGGYVGDALAVGVPHVT